MSCLKNDCPHENENSQRTEATVQILTSCDRFKFIYTAHYNIL